MPRTWQEIHADLSTRKRNVEYGELVELLEAAGFTYLRSSGSHRIFGKQGCFQRVVLKEGQRPALIGYVVTALRAVEECGDE